MTATHPDYIRDANLKIQKLAKDQTACRVLGHRGNVLSLCEEAGVVRTTLNSQLKKSQISPENQRALAGALKFRFDWREWTSGTADEFMEKYRSTHQATIQLSERQTGVRIAAGPRQRAIKCKIEGLASVEIQGHQFGVGTAAIELCISCGQPEFYGRGITIKSGRVELLCYPAMLSKVSQRQWMSGDGKIVGNRGGGHDRIRSRDKRCAGVAPHGRRAVDRQYRTRSRLRRS